MYYLTDNQGSVIGMVNDQGQKVAGYAYTPYGQTRTITGTTTGDLIQANANPYRYTSGYLDTTSNLYKLGYRYYDPTQGRFTQQDPSGQEPNHYAYAGGDPVNASDPNGLFCLFGNVDGGGSACRGASEARQAAPIVAAGFSAALDGCGIGAVAGEIVAPEALGGLPGCALGAVAYANVAIIDAGTGGTGDVPPAPPG